MTISALCLTPCVCANSRSHADSDGNMSMGTRQRMSSGATSVIVEHPGQDSGTGESGCWVPSDNVVSLFIDCKRSQRDDRDQAGC